MLAKPRVLDRGVAGDEVHEQPQPALVGGRHERVEVGERAVGRVDVRVVGDVVAQVGQRRGVDRRQPQRVDAQPGEVVEPALDPAQVADAVAVGVLERARVDLVDDGVLPPQCRRFPQWRRCLCRSRDFESSAVHLANDDARNPTGNTTDGRGGAIYNSTGASLTITSSTFNDNFSDSGSGVNTTEGGAIANHGTANLQNRTFANNSGVGNDIANSGSLAFSSCTFAGDTRCIDNTGTLSMSNSILYSSNFQFPPIFNHGSGTVTSFGYNITDDEDSVPNNYFTGTGDQINTNPRLDSLGLRDNGGLTKTVALLSDSPTIDKGRSFGLTTDQRGQVRPRDLPGYMNAGTGDGSDIGALRLPIRCRPGRATLSTMRQTLATVPARLEIVPCVKPSTPQTGLSVLIQSHLEPVSPARSR